MGINGQNIEIVDINNLSKKSMPKAVRTKPTSFKMIYKNVNEFLKNVSQKPENIISGSLEKISQKCGVNFFGINQNNSNVEMENPPKGIALNKIMFKNVLEKSKNLSSYGEIILKSKPVIQTEPPVIDVPIAPVENVSNMEIPSSIPDTEIKIEKTKSSVDTDDDINIQNEVENDLSDDSQKSYDPTDPIAVSENYKLTSEKYMDLRKKEREIDANLNLLGKNKKVVKFEGDRLLNEAGKCDEKIEALKARLAEWENRKNEITEAAQEKFNEENTIDEKIKEIMEEKNVILIKKPKVSEELESAKLDVVRLKEQLTNEQNMINEGLNVLGKNFAGMQVVEKSNVVSDNFNNSFGNESYSYPEKENFKKVA